MLGSDKRRLFVDVAYTSERSRQPTSARRSRSDWLSGSRMSHGVGGQPGKEDKNGMPRSRDDACKKWREDSLGKGY